MDEDTLDGALDVLGEIRATVEAEGILKKKPVPKELHPKKETFKKNARRTKSILVDGEEEEDGSEEEEREDERILAEASQENEDDEGNVEGDDDDSCSLRSFVRREIKKVKCHMIVDETQFRPRAPVVNRSDGGPRMPHGRVGQPAVSFVIHCSTATTWKGLALSAVQRFTSKDLPTTGLGQRRQREAHLGLVPAAQFLPLNISTVGADPEVATDFHHPVREPTPALFEPSLWLSPSVVLLG